jgi:hypothetical protein
VIFFPDDKAWRSEKISGGELGYADCAVAGGIADVGGREGVWELRSACFGLISGPLLLPEKKDLTRRLTNYENRHARSIRQIRQNHDSFCNQLASGQFNSRKHQLQLTPSSPKPAVSTRIYVPQNTKTLFMAHLLLQSFIRPYYFLLHIRNLCGKPHR